MKFVTRLVIAFALTGCTATPYLQPTDGLTATISFVNDSHRNLFVYFYEESVSCKRPRAIPGMGPTTRVEQTVRADAELTFLYYLTTYGSMRGEQYCKINQRFVPLSGHSYVFRTTEDSAHCRWAAFDVTTNEMPMPIELTQVPFTEGWDDNSSFCAK